MVKDFIKHLFLERSKACVILLFALFNTSEAFAQENKTFNQLKIEGREELLNFDDIQAITIDSWGLLRIKKTNGTFIETTGWLVFTDSETEAIGHIHDDKCVEWHLDNNHLILQQEAKVVITSADGKILFSADKCKDANLQQLSAGVYVFSINNKSFKVVKR